MPFICNTFLLYQLTREVNNYQIITFSSSLLTYISNNNFKLQQWVYIHSQPLMSPSYCIVLIKSLSKHWNWCNSSNIHSRRNFQNQKSSDKTTSQKACSTTTETRKKMSTTFTTMLASYWRQRGLRAHPHTDPLCPILVHTHIHR